MTHILRPICILLLVLLCMSGFFKYFISYYVIGNPDAAIEEATLSSSIESEIQIPATTAAPDAPSLHASYACVMDGDSLRSLYKKKANKKVPMASTTKIMTALLVLESGRLDETVGSLTLV